MRKICEIMAKNPLFEGMDCEVYAAQCEKSIIKTYWKGEIIVNEGEVCSGIGVIIEGQAAKQKCSTSGEYTTLNLISACNIFGEDLMFSARKKYPYTLEAITHCKIIMVSREDLLSMISKSSQLLLNYMRLLSDRVREQDERINLLSQKTLRLKICSYLLQLLHEQLEMEDVNIETALALPTTYAVELPVSKEVIAHLLAMPRPSFSRELISMENDGLIRVSGRVIWLMDLNGLATGVATEV